MRRFLHRAILGSLIFFPMGAFGALDSVAQSSSLTALFSTMAEIADEGPMMSYFGWTEVKSEMLDAKCKAATEDDAVSYLTNLVSEMDWASQEQINRLGSQMEAAMIDFRTILGSDSLQRCDHDFSENMTWTHQIRFMNLATGYQITFTEGYED